ncbi:tachylectin-related carbohydrate-binding protein [Streptomyces purpureus]|uniref:tachylectin-related carbohydrate-binding protein n=1 Tax=Streptomyces purpureus TaxID=1951 RepID=UPI0009971212|nr:tachylectin-related carbohydrate-binding protein [Streptomyces purpureus]
MSKRLTRLPSRGTTTAIAAVAVAPLLIAMPGTAKAATTVSCVPDAPLQAVTTAGALYQYKMKTPLTGSAYSGPATIGAGFEQYGRTLSGPGQSYYGFKADGVYYSQRNSAGGWTAGHRKIGSGLGFVSKPENRDRATVDRAGWIWTIEESGALKAYKYDAASGTWANGGSSKPLDEDWGRYTLITAGDSGVLYGRTADGKLYRSHFDMTTQRWLERHVLVSSGGWNEFKSISSNGGDTLVATQNSTGNALYYRYDDATHTWPVSRVKVGANGWTNFREVTASPDSCTLLTNVSPASPAIPLKDYTATTVLQGPTGKVELAYVDNIGRLIHGSADPAAFDTTIYTPIGGPEAFAGRPSLATHSDGRLSVTAHNTAGAAVWQRYRSTTEAWGTWNNQLGAMAQPAVTANTPSGLLAEFSADAGGRPWYRLLSKNGSDFTAWMPLPGSGFSCPFTAVAARHGIQLFGKNASGTLSTALFKEDGTLSAWTTVGSQQIIGEPAVMSYQGYRMRIFATTAEGNVVTTAQTAEGSDFSAWSAVPGVAAAGSPSAVLSPVTGTAEVVVRDRQSQIQTTGEVTQNSGTWRNWQSPGFESLTSATDPTAFTFSEGGQTWGYTFRNASNQVSIYRAQYTGTGAAALSSLRFAGGAAPAPK